MTTYDYMYDLGLRGTIDITIEQMLKLKEEGVRFYTLDNKTWEKESLVLYCREADEFEEKLASYNNCHEETLYITDKWLWKYLTDTYDVDDDNKKRISFAGVTVYWKGEK